MHKIRIAVCDDDRNCRKNVFEACRFYFSDCQKEFEFKEYSSGEEFCEDDWIPHCVFLDIEMNGMSGIEVKEKLWRLKPKTKIIYMTYYNNYMIEAFGRNVIRFLTKPIKQELFTKALDAVNLEYNSEIEVKLLVEGTGVKLVSSEILYISSRHIYSFIITATNRYTVRKSLNEWEHELNFYRFYRIHRSYLVNIIHVKDISRNCEMYNGISLPVSREKKDMVRQEFFIYQQEFRKAF